MKFSFRMKIFFLENAFQNIFCKMSAILFRVKFVRWENVCHVGGPVILCVMRWFVGYGDYNHMSCALQWRHNERDSISNHPPDDSFLNHLFRRRPKKTSKLRVTGLCEGNSLVNGEFPTHRASNAENVSIWKCHHGTFQIHSWFAQGMKLLTCHVESRWNGFHLINRKWIHKLCIDKPYTWWLQQVSREYLG